VKSESKRLALPRARLLAAAAVLRITFPVPASVLAGVRALAMTSCQSGHGDLTEWRVDRDPPSL
jgi:hypothetical protein